MNNIIEIQIILNKLTDIHNNMEILPEFEKQVRVLQLMETCDRIATFAKQEISKFENTTPMEYFVQHKKEEATQSGYIYILSHKVHGIYVGSSINVKSRLQFHKFYFPKIYGSTWQEWNKSVFEFHNISKSQLRDIEKDFIQNIEPNLNKNYKTKNILNNNVD